jgi:hypothetical protein
MVFTSGKALLGRHDALEVLSHRAAALPVELFRGVMPAHTNYAQSHEFESKFHGYVSRHSITSITTATGQSS